MSKKSTVLLLGCLLFFAVPVQAALVIWVNNGQDKVTRDDLRAYTNATAVHNSVWDGTTISLFGAKNETVAFDLILESPATATANITVTTSVLTGPGGFTISRRTVDQGDLVDGLFNYVGRNIELFYIRYLKIEGLSKLSYADNVSYDERKAPKRFQRPIDPESFKGIGTWYDRPDHDKFYPDIAVPLELHTPFSVAANTNQSIWGDIFIPKNAPAGIYTGTVTIVEGSGQSQITHAIPIELSVRNFTLPDIPTAKTMLCGGDVDEYTSMRYVNQKYPNPGTSEYEKMVKVSIRHRQMAHRHKISLIIGTVSVPADLKPHDMDQLTGEMFTSERGYDGVGIGTGVNILSIGTYGSWAWFWFDGAETDEQKKQAMWDHSNEWINWLNTQNFSTPTEYFLYLIDEPQGADIPLAEKYAGWLDSNPGIGKQLKSFTTVPGQIAKEQIPSLDIVASWTTQNVLGLWEGISDYFHEPGRKLYMYNGWYPERGSDATEDDGIALRVQSWAQYKKKIARWFIWESTYYDDTHSSMGPTNVFQSARVFGRDDKLQINHPALGRTGATYTTGSGVLFYPGIDKVFPAENYGIDGPIASIRLKLWRRGVQDVDYLHMAAQIDKPAVDAIINQMIPKTLWEFGAGDVSNPSDPTWVKYDPKRINDPDIWEAARLQLANIIEGGSGIPLKPTGLKLQKTR